MTPQCGDNGGPGGWDGGELGRGRWDGGELGRGRFLYVWILHKFLRYILDIVLFGMRYLGGFRSFR